jgi:anaerobic selenocysteine-containing dehydrogenase
MWYNYNPVFSNANSQQNMDILKDESLIPYSVAVTPFYDESSSLADLILPDTVYLEQFDFEDGVSPTQIPEYCIRQPVVDPQGESRDFKDVCCELADRMDFNLGFDSGEEFVEQACEMTPEVEDNAGGFGSMQELGIWQNPEAEPVYYSYRHPVGSDELREDGVIFDDETGVYWNWKSVGVANERVARSIGYRHTDGAHKGYVAQKFWDAIYNGFKPEEINKSGFFELYSLVLKDKGLPPLPTYTPIPEHQELAKDELILTTFRVAEQTLSRTQNCYWLDEITTDNPGWINPVTAANKGIAEGDRIRMSSHLGEIEATVKVTENVVPGVIAITSHGGRWEYGRSASGKKAPFGLEVNSQYEELKWWETEGVHPNWIIENSGEPVSGQQRWMDTVVTVSKA